MIADKEEGMYEGETAGGLFRVNSSSRGMCAMVWRRSKMGMYAKRLTETCTTVRSVSVSILSKVSSKSRKEKNRIPTTGRGVWDDLG